MPAVGSPQPDGLGYAELAALLGPLLASPLAAGMGLAIDVPQLDPEGRVGARLVRELAAIVWAAR